MMSPVEFMQRLAALVPRPTLHLIRFHSVARTVEVSYGMIAANVQRSRIKTILTHLGLEARAPNRIARARADELC